MRLLLLLLLGAGAASAASAQEVVRPECAAFVTPTQQLRFDPGAHRRWYARFWTGRCQGLGGCFSGRPNWNAEVGRLAARASAPQRGAVLRRACRVGQLIGHEWARDNDVRRVDNGDLRAFGRTLQSQSDVEAALRSVEAAVEGKLRAP